MNKQRRISKWCRLPKVLMDIVWSYDNRYRNEFKKTVMELNRYFNHNRMINHIKSHRDVYAIYMNIHSGRNNLLICNYPNYVLFRSRICGKEPIPIDNLKSISLRKRSMTYENENI
jgi:hypothetical protein